MARGYLLIYLLMLGSAFGYLLLNQSDPKHKLSEEGCAALFILLVMTAVGLIALADV